MSRVDVLTSVIREVTRIEDFSFDERGKARLQMRGNIILDLDRVGDGQYEISSPLDRFEKVTPDLMKKMLEFNYLGSGSGSGRLALHPFEKGFVICERIIASEIHRSELKDKIIAFMKYVKYWSSDTAMAQFSGETRHPSDVARSDDEMIFRV